MTLSLEQVVEKFLATRPRWRDIGEDGGQGLCEYASHEFVGFAAAHGFDGEVECIRFDIPRHWSYPEEALDGHWVARFGNKVVDLTAKQFGDSLPFPFIWTIK
jgi:hypothetical protein